MSKKNRNIITYEDLLREFYDRNFDYKWKQGNVKNSPPSDIEAHQYQENFLKDELDQLISQHSQSLERARSEGMGFDGYGHQWNKSYKDQVSEYLPQEASPALLKILGASSKEKPEISNKSTFWLDLLKKVQGNG